ncbi:MAG TPA: FAD-dependent oxidoreductase [Polyangiaceae bacterium]|nr:FAD-dependent oxidoreductase [Polyangiaceae bacterium]
MKDHRSTWQSPSSALASSVTALDRNLSADVCVVGAGMAGLLCALELAERGRSVVVVEREGIATGDTSMTTAHLTALLDTRYHQLAKMHGKEATPAIAESHLRAIAHLERVANAYEIECDFQRVSGFLCAADAKQASTLADEYQAARDAGIRCQLIRQPPLPIARGPALHVPNQAQFDPLAFLTGVVRALQQKGVTIYAPATVQSFEAGHGSEPITLHTSDRRTIRANNVIVATGSPVNDRATMHTKQAAYRTYAITALFADTQPALYWDMEDPYHYVRMATDAVTQRPVLIVGGEDHRVGQDPDNEQRFRRLEDWLRERFPRAGELVSQWSGQVFEPSDGLGFIGRNPGQERIFIITGESGNGMTYSAVAAQLIPDLVQGLPSPYEQIYAPSRKPHSIGAIGEFVRENLNIAEQYSDWVGPADVARAEDIARGQGAVLRRGLRRVAVYVDDQGTAHEMSATCPHLGGVVAWNPAEKSWDCPCHGSRFDCHGRVLQGPAVSGLKPQREAAARE